MPIRLLESITVEELWRMYCQSNPPPPEVSAEEIVFVRQIYFAGFGGAVMVAQRLLGETPERRAKVLEMLMSQVLQAGKELAALHNKNTN